jgi:hypothetical protein
MAYGFSKTMKPQAAICAECEQSEDTVELVNGDDKRRLCYVCIREEIADLVLQNEEISVTNHGDRLELL